MIPLNCKSFLCTLQDLHSFVLSVYSTGSADFGDVTFVVPGICSKALNHTEENTVTSGMSTVSTLLFCDFSLSFVLEGIVAVSLGVEFCSR